jgi:hypothetical protein
MEGINMRLRSILMSAAATISLAAGLGVGLPAVANASAGTGHGTASIMRLTVRNGPECTPGSLPGIAVHLFAEPNAGGDESSCACNPGVSTGTNLPHQIRSVENACDYRFYMQDDPIPGEAFCISGGSIRNDIGVQYDMPPTVKIGNSEQPC